MNWNVKLTHREPPDMLPKHLLRLRLFYLTGPHETFIGPIFSYNRNN